MTAVEDRLAQAGLTVPQVRPPVAAYLPAVWHDGLVVSSGQLPVGPDGPLATGLLGETVDVELGWRCAQLAALNALAAVRSVVGDLDLVMRVVRVVGYVASAPGFTGQPAVVNGASELLVAAFGECGQHARCAIGVAALPAGCPVEVEVMVSTRGD